MPQLDPSASKIARAPITVKPAGLICTAELYLVSNAIKVASSGEVPFTSTGGAQSVSFPITMPAVEGTYKVYIDVFSAGELIGAFVAREDVVIVALAAELHFVGNPIVDYGRFEGDYCWFYVYYDVRNDGGVEGSGVIHHHIWNSDGEYIMDKSVVVPPGETKRVTAQAVFVCPCWEHLHVYGEGSWGERTGIVSWSW